MNKQEAIKSMNNLDELISITESEHESVRMAISALEKQIPKKPIDSYNWEDLSEEERLETPRWYCKSCDGVIEEHYSYCALCGQAIDWEV